MRKLNSAYNLIYLYFVINGQQQARGNVHSNLASLNCFFIPFPLMLRLPLLILFRWTAQSTCTTINDILNVQFNFKFGVDSMAHQPVWQTQKLDNNRKPLICNILRLHRVSSDRPWICNKSVAQSLRLKIRLFDIPSHTDHFHKPKFS